MASAPSDELAFRSAVELASMLRRKELSSRALLEHFLARIEKANPRLNAVVTLDVERALAAADAADGVLARGGSLGALHGLPITIKDSFETEGLRTTCGAPLLADHVPTADADAVARLRGAGAIVFGKTNTPLLAGDVQTYNDLFGRTTNPWDPARTPGGSSGGAAAAVAAGLTSFELGSDIGGSIRTPASWCGVYGHKPSHGIVPVRGHIPPAPGALATQDLAVAGPIARSPADLELALDLLAGPDAARGVAWRLVLPPARARALRDFRVAAWLDDPAFPVDGAVGARLEATVDALSSAGVRVAREARPGFSLAELQETYLRLLTPVIASGFPAVVFDRLVALAEAAPPGAPVDDALRTARDGTARHRDWIAANERREQLRARLAAFFREFDVLLLPVAPVAAIPFDESAPITSRRIHVSGVARSYYELFGWIGLASATLHPATVAPVGRTAEGLPVGLQIVGPWLEDRTPLRFAQLLAGVIGGYEAPPHS
ncbi:MAG TPA: amidase [Myxococcota bacterium]|nr:amidase [Myxococcota bacterium]